jgi:hypothetical protein
MKFIITNLSWMPKRAAWLRPVAMAPSVGGGELNP